MGHGWKDEVRCGVVGISIGIALEVSSSSVVDIYITHERKDEEADIILIYQSLFPIKGVLISIVTCGRSSHNHFF